MDCDSVKKMHAKAQALGTGRTMPCGPRVSHMQTVFDCLTRDVQ